MSALVGVMVDMVVIASMASLEVQAKEEEKSKDRLQGFLLSLQILSSLIFSAIIIVRCQSVSSRVADRLNDVKWTYAGESELSNYIRFLC